MSALKRGLSSSCSEAKPVGALLAVVAWLALAAAPAVADDLNVGMMSFALGMYALVGIAFGLATWVIEAAVLNHFLKLGYFRCFVYAVVANFVSFLLGMAWASVLREPGWKKAVMAGEMNRVALLFLRSFAATVVEEGALIVLLVGKQRRARVTLGAVVAANAVTYMIGAVVMFALARFIPAL